MSIYCPVLDYEEIDLLISMFLESMGIDNFVDVDGNFTIKGKVLVSHYELAKFVSSLGFKNVKHSSTSVSFTCGEATGKIVLRERYEGMSGGYYDSYGFRPMSGVYSTSRMYSQFDKSSVAI